MALPYSDNSKNRGTLTIGRIAKSTNYALKNYLGTPLGPYSPNVYAVTLPRMDRNYGG
jgi:hypothetical protein